MNDREFLDQFSLPKVAPVLIAPQFQPIPIPNTPVEMEAVRGSDCEVCGDDVYSHEPLCEVGGKCHARPSRKLPGASRESMCACPGYQPKMLPKEFCGWNEDMDDRAVIASDGKGSGAVLWWVGPSFSYEIDEMGFTRLDELGLDDAPAGIHIWEGRTKGSKTWTDCGYEYDSWLEGSFRAPTDAEWEEIRHGNPPWEERDWWRKGLTPAPGSSTV